MRIMTNVPTTFDLISIFIQVFMVVFVFILVEHNMSTLYFLFFFISWNANIGESQSSNWTTMSQKLPNKTACTAIGHYEGALYFLGLLLLFKFSVHLLQNDVQQTGGYPAPELSKSLIRYVIVSNSIAFNIPSYLSIGIHAFGQLYAQTAQSGSSLFAIAGALNTVSLFNMETLDFRPSFTPSIPSSYNGVWASETSCLVHTGTHLVVIGGYYADDDSGSGLTCMNDVFTYDLNTNLWDNALPNMIATRAVHSCVFAEEEGMIYSIAGISDDGSNYLGSIEKLDVNDGISWQAIGSMSAESAGKGTRAVYYSHGAAVYVLGGQNWPIPVSAYLDTVHKIDVQTDGITLQPGMRLPYAMEYGACTIVIHNIWCAGGNDEGAGFFDTIINYSLLRIISFFANRTHNTKFYYIQTDCSTDCRTNRWSNFSSFYKADKLSHQ